MITVKNFFAEYSSLSKAVLTIVLLSFVTWYVAEQIVKEKTENLTNMVSLQVVEQWSLLKSIAETTARNGADQVTESIIRDCSVTERTRFDNLLGRLDSGLVQTDLVELERLFGRCGSFFAERKIVMSSRLEREIEVFENYVLQLSTLIGPSAVSEYQIETWKRLAEQEKKLSTEFSRLVDLQDDIITTLLSGNNRDSDEIQEILREVKNTQDGLIILNAQTSSTRNELITL